MLSFYSLLTLLPLAALAARIPHHLYDTDASLVADTKSTLGLGIIPRSPINIISGPDRDDPLVPVPIVSNVLHVVTGLLPDIEAGLSFCVTLRTDAYLQVGNTPGQSSVFLAAGICLCIDADVAVNPSPNGIKVAASTGVVYEGAFALKLKASVSRLHSLCMSLYTEDDMLTC